MSNCSQLMRVFLILLLAAAMSVHVAGCGGGGGGGGGTPISGLPGGGGGGGGGAPVVQDLGEVGLEGTVVGDPGLIDPGQSKLQFVLEGLPEGVDFQVPIIAREDVEFLGPFDGFDFVTSDGRNWTQSGLVYNETVGLYDILFKVNGETVGSITTDEDGNWNSSLDLNKVQSNIVELHMISRATGNTLHVLRLPFGAGLLEDSQEFAFIMIFDGTGGLMCAIRRLDGDAPYDNTLVIADFTMDFDGDNEYDQFNMLIDTRGRAVFDSNLDGVFGDPVGDALYDFDGDNLPDVTATDANFNRVFNEAGDEVDGAPDDQIGFLVVEPTIGQRLNDGSFALSYTEGTDLSIPFLIKAGYPGAGTPYGSTLFFEVDGTAELPQGTSAQLVYDLGYGCALAGTRVVPDPFASQNLTIRVTAQLTDGSIVEDSVVVRITVEEDIVPQLTSLGASSATASSLLTINGFGFSPTLANNVVIFGATPAVIFDATATRLRAFVPSKALVEDSPTAVDVTVISNGRPSTNGLPFTILPNGPVLFDTAPDLSATVPSNAFLILQFTRELNPATLAAGIDLEVASSGAPVAFTIDSSHNPFIVLDPALTGGTQYRLTVTDSLLGANGQPFDQISGGANNDFSTTFTAGAADNTGPSLLSVTPANGAEEVNPNNPITLTFSSAVDPTTLNGDGFNLELSGTGEDVEGVFAFNADYTTCVFAPTTLLLGNAEYIVTVSDRVTDPFGNGAGNGIAAEGVENDVTGSTIYTGSFSTTIYLADMTPISGPEGTEVQITGTGLSTDFEENFVAFNGVDAEVLSALDNGDNTVTLVVEVPEGATTGPVTVGTGSLEETAGNFAVTLPGFEVESIVTGQGPSSVSSSPSGRFLAVTNQDSGTLSIIELTGAGPVILHEVFIAPVVTEALWIPSGDPGPQDDLISVLHFGSPAEPGIGVFFVEAATGAIVDVVPVGLRPVRQSLSPDGQFLDVTAFVSGLVLRIDLASRAVVQSYQSGLGPDGVADNGSLIFSVNFFDDTMTIYNAVNNRVVGTVAVGDGPARVACFGNIVAVSLFNEDVIAFYNAVTRELLARVPVNNEPAGFDFTPDGAELLVACRGANTVDRIDVATFTNTGSIATGAGPAGLQVSPDGSLLYVTNLFADTVQIIFLRKSSQVIEALDPAFADPGQPVTIFGSGFDAGASVFVGSVEVPTSDVSFVDSGEIEILVPDTATTGIVTVVQNGAISNGVELVVTPVLPNVVSSFPAPDAVQVPVSVIPQVTFNEPMDASIGGLTNSSSPLRLERWNGSSWLHVPTVVDVSAHDGRPYSRRFDLTPTSSLASNTRYRFVLLSSLADASSPAQTLGADKFASWWTVDNTPPAFLGGVEFRDLDFNGIDAGDELHAFFTEAVRLDGVPALNSMFALSGGTGDVFGAGASLQKGAANEIVIVLGTNPQFTVAGNGVTKTLLAGATFGTPTALRYSAGAGAANRITDPYGNPVATNSLADITVIDGGAPALVSCLHNATGQLELNFSEAVYFDAAVGQAVASFVGLTPSGSLGTGGSIVRDSADARRYILTPGPNANFTTAGPYPTQAGSTGIFVSLANAFRDVAGNALPSGSGNAVDIGTVSEPGPKIAAGSVVFSDPDNNGIDAGDTLTFSADRDLNEGVLDAGMADFALNVAGDSFGAGAIVSYLGSRQFRITLGSNPKLTIKGLFDKAQRTIGKPSGLDFSAAADGIEDTFGNPAQDLEIVDANDNGIDIAFDNASPLQIVSAVLNDTVADGSVGTGDQIVVTFNKGILFTSGIHPLDLFALPVIGDKFGPGATVQPHADGNKLIAVLGNAPQFKPGNTFSPGQVLFGSPSGINLKAGLPMNLLSDLNGLPATPLTVPIDLDGQLSASGPMIAEVKLFDVAFDGPTTGDLLQIKFNSDVIFTGVTAADFAFIPSGTFGTNAQFFVSDTKTCRIALGLNPSFGFQTTFLDVAAGSRSKITDTFGTPSESSPTPVLVNNPQPPCLLDTNFSDANFNGLLDSGDVIKAIFDRPILFTSASASSQFVLLNANLGFSFGNGATVTADTNPKVLRIVLGTNPNLVLGGTYTSSNNQPGSPTGLGLAASRDIRDISGAALAALNCFADLKGSDNDPPQLVGAFGLEIATAPDGVLGSGDVVVCKFDENVQVSPNYQAKRLFNLAVAEDKFGQSQVDTINFSTNKNASNSAAMDKVPSVARNGAENVFVVTWIEGDTAIKGQRFNATGNPIGTPITYVTGLDSIQYQTILNAPASNSGGQGAFLLLYRGVEFPNFVLKARLIRSDGTVLAGPLTLTGQSGEFSVAYSQTASGGPNGDVYMIAFDDQLAPQDQVITLTANNNLVAQLSTPLAGVDNIVRVAADEDGNFALLYDSGSDLKVRRLTTAHVNIGAPLTLGVESGSTGHGLAFNRLDPAGTTKAWGVLYKTPGNAFRFIAVQQNLSTVTPSIFLQQGFADAVGTLARDANIPGSFGAVLPATVLGGKKQLWTNFISVFPAGAATTPSLIGRLRLSPETLETINRPRFAQNVGDQTFAVVWEDNRNGMNDIAVQSLGLPGLVVKKLPGLTLADDEIAIVLGRNARITAAGLFVPGMTASGLPSGFDVSATIPQGAITDFAGNTALDLGAPNSNDFFIDVEEGDLFPPNLAPTEFIPDLFALTGLAGPGLIVNLTEPVTILGTPSPANVFELQTPGQAATAFGAGATLQSFNDPGNGYASILLIRLGGNHTISPAGIFPDPGATGIAYNPQPGFEGSLQDDAGNEVLANAFYDVFTNATGGGVFEFLSSTPSAGANDVATNVTPVLYFSDNVNPTTLGMIGLTGPGGIVIPVLALADTGDPSIVNVNVLAPLAEETSYDLKVTGVESALGLPMTPALHIVSFTTIAGVAPEFVQIEADFAGPLGARNPMNKVNLNNKDLVFIRVGLPVPATGLDGADIVRVFVNGLFQEFSLAGNLGNPDMLVAMNGVNIAGLPDGFLAVQAIFVDGGTSQPLGGSVMAGNPTPSKDTQAPHVVQVQHDGNQFNVALDSDFLVTFSKPMDIAQGETPGTFLLQESGVVPIDVEALPQLGDPLGFASQFLVTPMTSLAGGEDYILSIVASALEGACLNLLDGDGGTPGLQDFEYSFSTTTPSAIAPVAVRIKANLAGPTGTRNPENVVNANNAGNPLIEIDIPNPPTGLEVGDGIQLVVEDFLGTPLFLLPYAMTNSDLNINHRATLNIGSTAILVDGDLTVSARFLDASMGNAPMGPYVSPATQPIMDTLVPQVSLFAFTDEAVPGTPTVDSAFDITLNKPVPVTEFVQAFSFVATAQPGVQITGALVPLDESGGLASEFEFTPTNPLESVTGYTLTLFAIEFEDAVLNQFDDTPGGPPASDYVNFFTTAFSGEILPVQVYIESDLDGGANQRNDINVLNKNNAAAAVIAVDLPNPPVGLAAGDKIQVRIEDFDSPTPNEILLPEYTLIPADLSSLHVVLPPADLSGLIDGPQTLEAKFVAAGGGDLGGYFESTITPEPWKDVVAPGVSDLMYTDDGFDAPLSTTSFTVFLTEPMNETDMASGSTLRLIDEFLAVVPSTITGVAPSGGMSDTFVVQPFSPLQSGEDYTLLIDATATTDPRLNQFDDEPVSTPLVFDNWEFNFTVSASGGGPVFVDYLQPFHGSFGDRILIVGENFIGATTLELGGTVIPKDVPSPGANGSWSILSNRKIVLTLPDPALYGGTDILSIEVDSVMPPSISFIYEKNFSPMGSLDKTRLAMGGPDGEGVLPPFDNDEDGGEKHPRGLAVVERHDSTQVFVGTDQNLVRFYSDANFSGKGNLSFGETVFELDEEFPGFLPEIEGLVAHPNPFAQKGYLALSNLGPNTGVHVISDLENVFPTFAQFIALSVSPSDDQIHALAVAPGGDLLAVLGKDGPNLRLWLIELNPLTGTPTEPGPYESLPLPGGSPADQIGNGLTFQGDRDGLFVSYYDTNAAQGYIDWINTGIASPTPQNVFQSGNFMSNLVVNPRGDKAYFAGGVDGLLYELTVPASGTPILTEARSVEVGPGGETLVMDGANELLYLQHISGVIDTIWAGGTPMKLTDRFVPGQNGRGLALVRPIGGFGPMFSEQYPYTLIVPCEDGANLDPMQFPQMSGVGEQFNDGYVAQLNVAYQGGLQEKPLAYYQDTNPEIGADELWITVFDKATGRPLETSGGWFTDTSDGLPLTGYAGEEIGMSFFSVFSAGDMLPAGTFAFDRASLRTAAGVDRVGVTVVDDAEFFDPMRAVSIASLDISAGNSANHLFVPIDCGHQSRSFVRGYMDPGNTGIVFTSPNDVRFEVNRDLLDEFLLPTPSHPLGDDAFVLGLEANVLNILNTQVLDGPGNLLGYSLRPLPRLAANIFWAPEATAGSGATITLLGSGDPGYPTVGPPESPGYDYSQYPGTADIFTNGLEAVSATAFADAAFVLPAYPDEPRSFSSKTGGAPISGASPVGSTDIKLFVPDGSSIFDIFVYAADNFGRESFSAARNQTTGPITSDRFYILPPAVVSDPVDGSEISYSVGSPWTLEYFNPINNSFGSVLARENGAPLDRGMISFQLEFGDIYPRCWTMIDTLHAGAPETKSILWPEAPLSFSVLGLVDSGYHKITTSSLALDGAGSGVGVNGGDGSLTSLDFKMLESDALYGSEGATTEFTWHPFGGGVAVFAPIGTPSPREGHVAFINDITRAEEVVLIGGSNDSADGGIPDVYDWSAGTIAAQTAQLPLEQFNGVGFPMKLGPSGPSGNQLSDLWVVGGRDGGNALDRAKRYNVSTDAFASPVDAGFQYDLRTSRGEAQAVRFWPHSDGSDTDESMRAAIVIGGRTGAQDLSVAPVDMLEFYFDHPTLTEAGVSASAFMANIDPSAISISGVLQPRHDFQALLLADYNESTAVSDPSDYGKALVLLFGGFDTQDLGGGIIETMMLDSVQLLEIDYTNAVNGTLNAGNPIFVTVHDLPPMNRPRALFSAAPMWTDWDTSSNDFVEQDIPLTTPFQGFYEVFLSGGALRPGGLFDNEGSRDTEIYNLDGSSLTNLVTFSFSSPGPQLHQRRFGHSGVYMNGEVFIVGGAERAELDAGPAGEPFVLGARAVESYSTGFVEVRAFLNSGHHNHSATVIRIFNESTGLQELFIGGGRHGTDLVRDPDEVVEIIVIPS